MGVSNYLKAKSDGQRLEKFRATEEMHIERIPHGERDEVRHIYAEKGFSGENLDHIVDVITSNRKVWIDTMLTEEWGLQLSPPHPIRSGMITFAAFLLAGMVPILPLFLGFSDAFTPHDIFVGSAVLTAVTFFVTGAFRGHVLGESLWRSAIETLLVGSIAALLAYVAGDVLGGILE
jgi:VIT1/CCC1 family predicted Fe2+/Mn2+ transporter